VPIKPTPGQRQSPCHIPRHSTPPTS
jgi:hypothetical protein